MGEIIRGIGIDTVTISEIARYIEEFGEAYVQRTFTKEEVNLSKLSPNPSEYLATRFAVKEAVFKAIAHLTKEKMFDFRIIETLNHTDGSPYVNVSDDLKPLFVEADINVIHLSITTEGDYATAFIIAVKTI